jgi:hypothetical protein
MMQQAMQSVQSVARELPHAYTDLWRYNIALVRSLNREHMEFLDSTLIAAQTGFQAARDNPLGVRETFDVMQHSSALLTEGLLATREKVSGYLFDQLEEGVRAFLNTVLNREGETIAAYLRREADVMEAVADFHEQIEKIKDEFGFQFATPGYKLAHETDSFLLYQVLPTKKGVKVRDDRRPMILVPPYMLGAHILSFLPGEHKSYAHAFANEGVPTYVRVVKDIMTTEAVQNMTPDDDCTQTRELCEQLVERHGKKVTLNGTCQGGYICLMNVLSGTYKDVCDTIITNVAPIDGTYSDAISGMPTLHHDFITDTLPNGKKVANGYLLSLGMRFVAIDRETPLIKVLDQVSLHKATDLNPGKTVAALFRWLLKERVHLPLEIAKMSSHTFQEPISKDGELPVSLYGQPLNVRDLAKLNVRWYQDYAIKDDLVTPDCATAANKFLEGTGVIESVPFPGGHVAILTSPHSKRAPVNGRFKGKDGTEYRGPVAFQMELDASA